jgi:phenylalanyl-tRNA synthetase beta chain
MKIAYSYLKNLIPLSETPEEVGTLLTAAGLEVEHIEKYEKVPGGLSGIVIGRVLTCTKHPEADRLHLTTVDVGNEAPLSIICGAPNVAAGQTVVVATVGAKLYPTEGEPFEIKKSKIRGALSEGMICAEDELGLGSSHDGILVLQTDLPPGTPAAEYFNLGDDYVFEIGLTPNRADAASHLGVARDLKALLNRKICLPTILQLAEFAHLPTPITVEIQDAQGCPRYCGLSMSGVKVAESPAWLQDFLKSIGLKPINNIVDITNLVLHELGQPMHAFDAQKISGGRIIVRRANEGEQIITLDKTSRTCTANDLVIADVNSPIALAGVMGGLHSAIDDNTTEIFLESAYFNPVTVRKSSQHHALKSDSSFRFERGTDPNMPFYALQRAAHLITALAGGRVSGAPIDVYPSPIKDTIIKVRYAQLERLIGIEIDRSHIQQILQNLDIKIEPEANYGHPGFEESFTAHIPPYRVDVQTEADIAEEVLRIYGFDNVPLSDTLGSAHLSERPAIDGNAIYYALSRQLSALGFNEIMTNSLSHKRFSEMLGSDRLGENVVLLNRLSEDLEVMRQSLLFSTLEALAYNINRRQKSLKVFELGKVYWRQAEQIKEKYQLALAITGQDHEHSWRHPSKSFDIFNLKSAVSLLFNRMNIRDFKFKESTSEPFAYTLDIADRQHHYGKIGMVKPTICLEFGIKQNVFFAALEWERMLKSSSDKLVYNEVSKFPEVRRDLSLVISKQVKYEQIVELARQVNKKLIQQVQVFDIFEGEQLGADKKSYSVSFTLQDADQTLTDQVIDKTMERIISVLETQLQAQIRR